MMEHVSDEELLPVEDPVAGFKRAIEAVVLVAHDPVEPELLAQLLEQPVASVERWCEELRAEYAGQQRGFELARIAGGYRYQTHPEQTPYVERFVLNDQKARLSGAALETLAIVAYKQPISRAQVASIRGVDTDGVIRTLQARGMEHDLKGPLGKLASNESAFDLRVHRHYNPEGLTSYNIVPGLVGTILTLTMVPRSPSPASASAAPWRTSWRCR